MTQYFAGQWQAGAGAPFASLDPVDQRPLWQGRAADAAQVDAAVAAARAAFADWRDAGLDARAAVARRFAQLLGEQQAELAALIGRETGKPRWEALTEVQSMIAKVDISLKAQAERAGERAQTMGDAQAVLRHRPQDMGLLPDGEPVAEGKLLPPLAGVTAERAMREHLDYVARRYGDGAVAAIGDV